MRQIFSLVFVGLTSIIFSQQQHLGTVYLTNSMNPPLQTISDAVSNISTENLGNNFSQQGNFNKYINEIQAQTQSVVKPNRKNQNGNNFSLSLIYSSRSPSTVSSPSVSKSHKHVFVRKLKKLERNFYGKINAHKKSKHLVDVCFNWR